MVSGISKKYEKELNAIIDSITEQLSDSPNFLKVKCRDGYGRLPFNLAGFLKRVPNYVYVSVDCDMEDVLKRPEQTAEYFVKCWEQNDNAEDINSFVRFISDGIQYGWD